jgi:hypothetical protein
MSVFTAAHNIDIAVPGASIPEKHVLYVKFASRLRRSWSAFPGYTCWSESIIWRGHMVKSVKHAVTGRIKFFGTTYGGCNPPGLDKELVNGAGIVSTK